MSDVEATSPADRIAAMWARIRDAERAVDDTDVFDQKERRKLLRLVEMAYNALDDIRPVETAAYSHKMARASACVFAVNEALQLGQQAADAHDLTVRLQAAIDPTCEIPHDADTIAVLRGLVERMEKR